MDLFNVVVSTTCANRMEDIRSFNEVTLERVETILGSLGPHDTAVVRTYEDNYNYYKLPHV